MTLRAGAEDEAGAARWWIIDQPLEGVVASTIELLKGKIVKVTTLTLVFAGGRSVYCSPFFGHEGA